MSKTAVQNCSHCAQEEFSPEELRRRQWAKFTALANQIWPGNRFYRNKWQKAGLAHPGELKDWADFYRLPFTEKSELARDQENNPPYGSNLTFPLSRYIRLHQTSGTTGRPIYWLDTEESWNWWAECWGYVYRGAGVSAEDIIYFPFSFGPFIGFWAAFEGARKIGALAIPGGGQDTPTRLQFILDNRPTVVVCTPTYALRLAEAALEKGIDLAATSVRTTIHAGEPGASLPHVRSKIETLWGARCFDHHGMTEMGAISFTCQGEPRSLHVIESEYIVEVRDPRTGELCPDGREGELILTNLGRAGMPLIRYRTGDRVRLNREPCSCGSPFVRLDGGILGRVDDMFIVRGVNIFPSAIENILRKFSEISEFRIIVSREREMNELSLQLEVAEDFPPEEVSNFLGRVKEEIKNNLQIRVEVAAVPFGTLERFDLKARRIIRK
ncbi:MAG: phenylacetate--CoA ligase family protein [Desulfotomaculales bacterium]